MPGTEPRMGRPALRRVLALWFGLAGLGCVPSPAAAGPRCAPEAFVVAVDAGHHRASPGAISARGVPEFEFNRRLATLLLGELRGRGFTAAFGIGASGEPLSLADRAELANRGGADLLISIHHDSVQPRYLSDWRYGGRELKYSDEFSGYSIFYSEKNPAPIRSKLFRQLLGSELRRRGLRPSLHHAEPIPGENRDLIDGEKAIYRFDDLVVLRAAEMPAVLIECGIIVNREEEERLRSPRHQGRIIAAIAGAVRAYCDAVS